MNSAPPNPRSYKKVLLVRTDRIGDMLVTTPCFRAIRKALPECRIDLLASPLNCPVVQDNPYLDHVYVFKRQSPWSWLSTIIRSRAQAYDGVLVFNSLSRSTSALAGLFGARDVVPVGPLPPYGGRYTFIVPAGARSHMILSMLDILEYLGIPAAGNQMDFVVPEAQARRIAVEIPKSRGKIRLAIFLGNVKKPKKLWPLAQFRRLIENMLPTESDLEIVLLAGKLERPLLSHFDGLDEARVLRFVGDSLQETGAFLQTCDAVLTGSSGPAHLASALGIPVLSIITRLTSRLWVSLGEDDVFVAPDTEINDVRGISLENVEGMLRGFLSAWRTKHPES